MEVGLRDQISGYFLYLLSQVVRRTCRFSSSGYQYVDKLLENNEPVIISAWHGMTMMLLGYFSNMINLNSIALIMPDDWRGRTLFVFTQRVGTISFPMNLDGEQSMATGRQLIKFVKKMQSGTHAFITPDGPEGPSYKIKPGIFYIAQKTGAPILPIGAYNRHGYRLKRWDRYSIPFPFSRVSIEIGQPYNVRPENKDLSEASEHLTNLLHRVTAQAAANYYEIG